MIEYVIVFQLSVTVVIEIDPHLLPGVYPIPAQHRRAARCDPDAGQGVGVDLILLDEALALLVHVDAAVLSVVDLVVTNNRVAVRADLDAGQSVACERRLLEILVWERTQVFEQHLFAILLGGNKDFASNLQEKIEIAISHFP